MPPPFTLEGSNGDPAAPPRVLTIGHSNHDSGLFLELLGQHGLQTLVDVRSAPYSRYAPQFNRDSLAALLNDAGIDYAWAGDSLGGRPADAGCYRGGVVRPGNVDYDAVARQSRYQDGLRQLLGTAGNGVTAIMCSEEDPRRCHRHRLIEPSLRERGAVVLHIRRDGSLELLEPDEAGTMDVPSPQLALLGFAG